MNKKILKKYQERLNDISRRNRAIRLSRIVKKKVFDLSDLNKIEKGKGFKVLKSLFFNKKSINLISLNAKNRDEERILKDLTYLYRDLDFLFKERGFYECFLGYPFIQGNFLDGSFFRAPLFLLPVQLNLNRESKKISLKVRDDSKLMANKTFFMALNKYNKGRNSIDLEELKEVEDLSEEELIPWAEKLFRNSGFEVISKNMGKEIIKLNPLRKDEHPKDLLGKIEFKSLLSLGQFSQMNSAISNDYESLIKQNLNNKLSKKFLGEELERDLEKRYDEDNFVDSPEKDNFFITNLDISQEKVLVDSRKGDGRVIHGPPGTGKSQVITNLIADNLQRGKKILLVCDKRPALDVVKNRLAQKGIHRNCVLVHDYNNDRNSVFRQMASVLENYDIEAGDYFKESEHKIKRRLVSQSEEIDKNIKEIRKLIDVFHNHEDRGIPLYALYNLSKKGLSNGLGFWKLEDKNINFKELQQMSRKISALSNNFYRFEDKEFALINRKRFEIGFDETSFRELIVNSIKEFEKLERVLYSKNSKKQIKLISSNKGDNFKYLRDVYGELKQVEKLKDKSFLKNFNLSWWKLNSKYSKLLREEEFKSILSNWKEIDSSLNLVDEKLKSLSEYFQDKEIEKISSNIFSFKSNLDFLKSLKKVFPVLEDIILFDSSFEELNKIEKTVALECFKKIPLNKNIEEIWNNTIKQSFYLKWINEIESKHPEIKGFSESFYNKKISELNDLIKKKVDMIPAVIQESLFANYVNEKWKQYDFDGRRKNYNHLKDFIHEVKKKRRKMTIRELVEHFWAGGLPEIFPCWMCSPETVSAIFPMKKDFFDLVIFDEASQLKLEKSVPTIFRAKKIIVTGDDKQLPPTSFFMSEQEEIEEDYDYEEKQLIENESLLEQAKIILPNNRLLYHYRSEFEELIDFSNYAFYENTLRIMPKNRTKKEMPIEYNNVKGTWESGVNKKEAEAIVKKVKELLSKRKNTSTLGIITFNFKQRDLIKDLLDEEGKKDSKFGALLDGEYSRYEGDEYQGLFVKNIENVQGDERDIIIFSIGYGYDKSKKFRYHFGPINGPYGPNRLNVAISRSRKKIIIFSSFEVSDLKYAGTYEGPKLLKNYLNYSKFISDGKPELAYDLLENYIGEDKINEIPEFEEYDSDFEGEVRDALVSLGYKVKTQVGSMGYKIDLVVVHPKDKNKFLAGIECDGAKYHSSPSAKERDLYRQKILEDNGWDILRVWSRDWWKDEDKIVKILDRELKKLLLKNK